MNKNNNNDAMQFIFNSVPYESLEEAIAAIEKKHLLTAEPAYVLYRDNKKRVRQFLVIGMESKGHDTHPLYLGLPHDHHLFAGPMPGPHYPGDHCDIDVILDGGIVDLNKVLDRLNHVVDEARKPHHADFDITDVDPRELEMHKLKEDPKYGRDPMHELPRDIFGPNTRITPKNEINEFSFTEREGMSEVIGEFDYDELHEVIKG